MSPTLWTPSEIDRLNQLAGNLPYCELPRVYNNWAKRHGYARRTAGGIRQKIFNLGLSAYPSGDWLRTTAVAEGAGVTSATVRHWITTLDLPATMDGVKWAVRRRDLVEFARLRPHLFIRASRAQLIWLLEDSDVVDLIFAAGPHPLNRPRRTRCVETGRIYPSISTAARANYVVRQVVRKAIRTGGLAGGYHWTWA